MAPRSYGQYCGIAKALDLVGERWALLVVRELLEGPKRYTDLLDGLPGIATDVLATRLRALEDAGVVARRTLPPPAASKVYELTDLGRGLGPAVGELSRWGMQLLGPRTPEDAFRLHWLVFPLRTMFRPDEAVDDLTVRFEVEGGTLVIQVRDGGFETVDTVEGDEVDADVVVRSDVETLADITLGRLRSRDATTTGRVVVEGSPADRRRYSRIFGFDRKQREAGRASAPA